MELSAREGADWFLMRRHPEVDLSLGESLPRAPTLSARTSAGPACAVGTQVLLPIPSSPPEWELSGGFKDWV